MVGPPPRAKRRRTAHCRGQTGGCWEISLKRGEGKMTRVLRNYKIETQRNNNNAQKQWSKAQLAHAVYSMAQGSKSVRAVVSYHRTLYP